MFLKRCIWNSEGKGGERTETMATDRKIDKSQSTNYWVAIKDDNHDEAR